MNRITSKNEMLVKNSNKIRVLFVDLKRDWIVQLMTRLTLSATNRLLIFRSNDRTDMIGMDHTQFALRRNANRPKLSY